MQSETFEQYDSFPNPTISTYFSFSPSFRKEDFFSLSVATDNSLFIQQPETETETEPEKKKQKKLKKRCSLRKDNMLVKVHIMLWNSVLKFLREALRHYGYKHKLSKFPGSTLKIINLKERKNYSKEKLYKAMLRKMSNSQKGTIKKAEEIKEFKCFIEKLKKISLREFYDSYFLRCNNVFGEKWEFFFKDCEAFHKVVRSDKNISEEYYEKMEKVEKSFLVDLKRKNQRMDINQQEESDI